MNGSRAAVAPLTEARVRTVTVDRSRAWRRLTLGAALCVTLLDAALLQRKHGLFTGGFLSGNQLGTLADGVAFLLLSGLLNTTIAAPLALTALVAGRWLRLKRFALHFAVYSAALLPLATANFVTYQVWSYLGDTFDFHLMYDLTGRRLSEIFAVTTPVMSRPLFVFFLALGMVVLLTGALQRFERGPARRVVLPTRGRVLQRCVELTVLSSIVVTVVSMTSESMGFALRWTPSGQLFSSVLNRISDIDRDGHGILRNPRDQEPLNARIHPYALDLPGNGIDENGIGGDLPRAAAPYEEPRLSHATWPDTPPVLLFVLESVRADAIGTSFNRRRITPVLDALAGEGIRVDSAWSHNGFTGQSRYHILTGSLLGGRGGDTLLDDFKAHGYEVAYFSGQDDEFGRLGLSFRSADWYYDARHDTRNRYTASATPGSLAVPLEVLETRIAEYLKQRRSNVPLFMYVNFHDTHYPYNHSSLENLVGGNLLDAPLISPARRQDLWRTYLNTLANVDRAIGRTIDTVEAHTGRRPAVVVIGDHGESLFEHGFLGHGYALSPEQTRIPFILRGLPARIPVPFGQSNLRNVLNDAMSRTGAAGEVPSVRPSRDARVFQYLGDLPMARQIGWVAVDGPVTYDFRTDRVSLWESEMSREALVGEPRRRFMELVHTWERILLAGRER